MQHAFSENPLHQKCADAHKLLEQGQVQPAKELFESVLEAHPAYIAALMGAGVCCRRLKLFDQAEAHFRAAAEADTSDTKSPLAIANLYLQQGMLGRGWNEALAILEKFPETADAIMILGQCMFANFQREGDLKALEEAIHHFERVLEINPIHRGALLQSALAYAKAGVAYTAEQRFITLCDLVPDEPLPLYKFAEFYTEHHHLDKALVIIDKFLKLLPGNMECISNKLFLLERMHRMDEAEALLNSVMDRAPEYPALYLRAAFLARRNKQYEQAIEYCRKLIAAAGNATPLAMDNLIGAHYEIGKAYDKLKQYDAAYHAYEEANRVFLSGPDAKRFDGRVILDDLEMRTQRMQRAVADDFSSWPKDQPADGLDSPIFLLGFMRSGTTLMETILAAHPKVEAFPEYPILGELVVGSEMITGVSVSYPESQQFWDSDALTKMRSAYWERATNHLLQAKTSPDLRYMDKMPLNTGHLDLIVRLFPDAPVIMMLRDPRDVVLSCFMQSFAANPATVEVASLEHAARLYDYYMRFWQSCEGKLPLNILTVRYETLVTDFDAEVRRIVDHCGLPWNDKVLRYHEDAAKRSVNTPSYEGVTQPVYTGSIGRWKDYERYMLPALEILRPHVEMLGYA